MKNLEFTQKMVNKLAMARELADGTGMHGFYDMDMYTKCDGSDRFKRIGKGVPYSTGKIEVHSGRAFIYVGDYGEAERYSVTEPVAKLLKL